MLNRLPKGNGLSLWSPEIESEYNPGVLVEGMAETEENGTRIQTAVYCYGDGEYVVFTRTVPIGTLQNVRLSSPTPPAPGGHGATPTAPFDEVITGRLSLPWPFGLPDRW